MIPTQTALRTIADLIWRLADRQDIRRHDNRRAGIGPSPKDPGRRDAINRLRSAARRLDEAAAKSVGQHTDPAAVGYLCCWVRGDHDSLCSLLDYLHRRSDPRWLPTRDSDHSDRAATVLAALTD